MARIIGQERVAEVFGVAPKTIVDWQEQGFPVAVRGSPGVPSEYDTQACIEWYVQRALDRAGKESARDRLARIQGDKALIEIAQLQRELVKVEEVEPAIKQWLTDHCAELDQIPDSWVDPIVAAGGDTNQVLQLLKDMVRSLKESAAAYEFSTSTDQEVAPDGL